MYKSPIEIIHEIQSGVKMQIENGILEAVGHYGINVDKDELIRALQYDRQQYEKGYDDGKAEALQWIPCSERLPKDSEYVLITIRRLNHIYNQRPFISTGYVGWNGTTWWCAHDGWCDLKNIEVIAWMPLPEPYKERT